MPIINSREVDREQLLKFWFDVGKAKWKYGDEQYEEIFKHLQNAENELEEAFNEFRKFHKIG